jgi:hypothetical protein
MQLNKEELEALAGKIKQAVKTAYPSFCLLRYVP